MTNTNIKTLLRAQIRNIRKSIPDSRRQVDADNLKLNVIKILKSYIKPETIVGTYYPVHSEIIPPHDLNDVQMALPVVRDKVTLEFYPWSPAMRLIKRNFDIPIPDTRGLVQVYPDILLMPLVACDIWGNRIGGGAGHYDRYIASCDKKPLLVGVCFDEQVLDSKIPAERHDIPLDLIITPKRIINIKNQSF
jgi:5-formyltetrahydrofolate cyclo-ligase